MLKFSLKIFFDSGVGQACDRCVRLGIPCNAVKAKLICKECQTCKIICPRTFNNIVRVLAEKLGESEEDMRSKHIQFMAPSRQKEMVRKVGGVVNGEAAKDKAKKGEASVHGGLERRRRREKQKPPMIFIPGGRANKPKEIEIRGIDEEEISPKTTCATLTFSETQFECSNSRTPLGEMPNEDALEMNADAPWISKPQSKRSDPRLPRSNNEAENSTQIGGNGPGLSTPQPNSQLPLPNDTRAVDNDSESSSQMRIDVPRMSIPQPRCSESQDLYASNGQTAMGEEDTPASEITLGVPELSKSQPQPSHSHLNLNQVPDNDEDFLQMHVDTPTPPNPGHSRFNVQTSSISLELKRKMWDDLSRAGLYEHLETYETEKTLTRQHLHEIWDARDALGAQLLGVTEELEIYRTKVKHLEDTDLPSEITTEWDHLKELLANAGSEVQQARNQRLEAESELPVLRKKVETLTEERDRALNKSQQFKDLHLKAQAAQLEIRQVRSQGLEPESELSQSQKKVETQAEERDNEAQRLRDSLVPKPFGWGAPVNGWTAWDQVCDEEISVRGRLSSLGAQSNVQVENPGHIAALGEVLAIRCRMLEEEKNRRMELEKEVSNLRSDRGEFIPSLVTSPSHLIL